MYIPVATPFRNTPARQQLQRAIEPWTSGTSASTMSIETPTTIALLIVPIPAP